MKEWWEGKFDKKPDPDYIMSVLIDIFVFLYGVKLTYSARRVKSENS